MAKRKFDLSGHPCEVTDLDKTSWFYVQNDGLIVCAYTKGYPTEIVTVPWRMVRRAIADHDKAKDRRRLVGVPGNG